MSTFKFKLFNEMTDEDYALVGFRSGLEIHQQLLTDKKLFCRCPAGKYSEKFDAEILRHMRPTLSELGEYDGTALMEFKTKKDIIYRINRETVCTYEMDDTPPFLINDKAVDIALEIALLYGCKTVDEIHIARKQYLDGSIPTGFQRTAIIALDGKIPFKGREIEIIQLSVEEDSCREISDYGHQRVYNTDRLGMPLIETVTGPDMRTPAEVSEVAQVLRKLVRSTGKVRTGIGAARQDVNVSVNGGTRIEIKGVPKILKIPLLTYNEAMRQWNLLLLRDELHRRNITADTFSGRYEDVTKLLTKTYYLPVKDALQKNFRVKCIILNGFRDLLNWPTQTDTYFSREISDRVRVIACLSNIPNIIHTDSKGESISAPEWSRIKKFVNASDDDSLLLTWGPEEDSVTAAKEILIRAKEATIGVPSETRQALRDGTNGFERILPGPDRMYPDTDLPPRKIQKEHVLNLKKNVPEVFWEREKWYAKIGVPADVAPDLSISEYVKIFEEYTNYGLDAVTLSVSLIQYPKRLRKEGLNIGKLNVNIFRALFDALKKGEMLREGIYVALKNYLSNGVLNIPEPAKPDLISEVIEQSKEKIKSIRLFNNNNESKILLTIIMDLLRGRVKGKDIIEKLGGNS